ncbi:MerC domain-containing protein [Roseivirga sp.]|uniref:MerC domain-containing protein n=1 Tax=Roseivirga sp. TaxID=1964215 RepID=UPI003B8D54AD
MNKSHKSSIALDDWGIGVSLLCSVHCALMPVLIFSSAIVGMQIEQLERLESPLLLLAAVIGSVSVLQSYTSQKKLKPALFLAAGLVLILIGGLFHETWLEPVLRICGSLFIVLAHFTNKKFLRASR